MAFRKRNRFYKPKSQDINLSSNEEISLSEYLANERRDEMIKSLPEKPNIRWWTKLGDEIAKNEYLVLLFGLIIYFIMIISKIFFEIFENHTSIWVLCIFTFPVIFTVIIISYKKAIKIFKESTFISKIKIFLDIVHFIKFLLIIGINEIILYCFTESIFEPLTNLYKNDKVQQLIKILMAMLRLNPEDPNTAIIIIWIGLNLIYALALNYVLTGITKTTFESFNKKWKNYKPQIFIVLYKYIAIFLLILFIWYLTKIAGMEHAHEIDNYLSQKLIVVYVVIYILSLYDLVIANYNIDKKLIAEYEEKLNELQKFTARINRYGMSKISRN